MVPGIVNVFGDYGRKFFETHKEEIDVFMKISGYENLELPTGQLLEVKR